MKPEIMKLRSEFITQQRELIKHRKKLVGVRHKVAKLFKEDKSISFDDFKYAEELMDEEYGFEFAALARLDTPNLKEILIKNALDRLEQKRRINLITIAYYFEHIKDPKSADNVLYFECDLDWIIEYYLKDVIDYIKNHMGENPEKFFKDYYGRFKK